MKRFTVAILAVLYFTISTGMVVNLHYCMGKLSSVKVDVLVQNLCGCGKKETKGCCKTEHKFIKLEDSHKASAAVLAFQAPVQAVEIPHSFIQAPIISQQDRGVSNNHSPPDISKQDTYLQNCVFRI